MYYPCSENKGADQLHGYREADLRLFFTHMLKSGFLMSWLIFSRHCMKTVNYSYFHNKVTMKESIENKGPFACQA